jgi:hypothetical protein
VKISADVLAGAEIFVTLQGSAVNRFKKRRRRIGKVSKSKWAARPFFVCGVDSQWI